MPRSSVIRIGTISPCVNEVDVDVEWRIDNFFSVPVENGKHYCSPLFNFGGEKWYLGITSNHRTTPDTSGYVNLLLCKYNSRQPTTQEFCIYIKNAKGEKHYEGHFTKVFKKENPSYVFKQFLPSSELSTRQSELVPHGVLTVVCTMRKTTSTGSDEEVVLIAEVNKSAPAGSGAAGSLLIAEVKKSDAAGSVLIAEVNKSDAAGSAESKASGSNQATSTETKEVAGKGHNSENSRVDGFTQTVDEEDGVLTCKKEKFKKSSKGRKRKMEEENGEGCTSGSSTSPQQKKVLHDFKELFLKKEDCDVIMRIKGSEFLAHRVILKARSPVFASIFRNDIRENATTVVEIEDCDPSTFSDFLSFLYCGDVGTISPANVFGFFTAADKYKVLDLREECLEFMKKNLTIDTFCETISLALQHSETELIELATNFFVKNAKDILPTVKWQTFVAENPTQSNKLFIEFVKSVKHSNA